VPQDLPGGFRRLSGALGHACSSAPLRRATGQAPHQQTRSAGRPEIRRVMRARSGDGTGAATQTTRARWIGASIVQQQGGYGQGHSDPGDRDQFASPASEGPAIDAIFLDQTGERATILPRLGG
jgi:hypothetical protein